MIHLCKNTHFYPFTHCTNRRFYVTNRPSSPYLPQCHFKLSLPQQKAYPIRVQYPPIIYVILLLVGHPPHQHIQNSLTPMQEFFFKLVEETDSYCAMSYHGDEPHVIIPSTHWGRPVTMLFDDLFKNHHEITSVVIPDSVREIGGFAFDNCDNLLNITLPANLENLWQYAFVRSSVEEVILPPGIRYIYPFTFKDCKRLRRVVCNDSLEKIWMSAFDGCHLLSQLLYGPNVTIVPN